MTETSPLRLLAEDAEDLELISAALQDAIGRIGDIAYEKAERRVTLVLNRFCWERDAEGKRRVRTALQFGSVLGVKARKLRRDKPDAVRRVAGRRFRAGRAARRRGAAALRRRRRPETRVECIDAALADLTEPWPARHAPAHDKA